MALSIKYILLNRYLYHNEAIKIENLLNPFQPILALILAMCVITYRTYISRYLLVLKLKLKA